MDIETAIQNPPNLSQLCVSLVPNIEHLATEWILVVFNLSKNNFSPGHYAGRAHDQV